MYKKLFSLSVVLLCVVTTWAQQPQPAKTSTISNTTAKSTNNAKNNKNLIQFSGVVVSSDSLSPIPYASVIVKRANRGTISDYFGYFSFVAQKKDTLEFSAIGYSSAFYIIPDTLTGNAYSLIQVLKPDTMMLTAINIYPWPSKEHFKQAFLNLNITDKDLYFAAKNLQYAAQKGQMQTIPGDAASSYKNSAQEYQSRLYYAGQYPPINLLNPIAWSKFIKAWQNGDFNKK